MTWKTQKKVTLAELKKKQQMYLKKKQIHQKNISAFKQK